LSLPCLEEKSTIRRVNYWTIVADTLSRVGWSWDCVSRVDSEGRTLWIVDAHRDNGKSCRFGQMNAVSIS
jgi:hypothetical protein